MPHPNEDLLRKAYDDFGRGDVDAYLNACTDDFTFNVPGSGPVSGSYKGRERFLELVGKVMQLSGGQFEEQVEDVFANDRHGVVLATHRVPRGGEKREYITAHVYHIRDGKLAVCWEQPRDQALFDAAWS